jgi:hypothetical protein
VVLDMADNSFYQNMGFSLKWNVENPTLHTESTECEENFQQDDILKNQIAHFEYETKDFFQKYDEEAPNIVLQFLNEELIYTDSERFVKLYNVLLHRLSLERDKEIYLRTLWMIVLDEDGNCKERVVNFLREKGLARETEERFKDLKMEEEMEGWSSKINS